MTQPTFRAYPATAPDAPPPKYRLLIHDDGLITIATRRGTLVTATNGAVYRTKDENKAREALDFLTADCPRTSAHWLKSTFGLIR